MTINNKYSFKPENRKLMSDRPEIKSHVNYIAFKGSKSCHSNEVAEVVNGADNNAEDSHVDKPCIRIDGLLEHVNKEMLEMFFQIEEKKIGGKVKSIEIDRKSKCATVLFDEKAAVDAFMQRNPKTILGMDVTVKVLDTAPKLFHAESTCIKITGLMDNMNKQMLEMFFYKEERNGGGKVKSIDLDSKNKCATVEFEDETGVDLIMKKTPMAIFGLPVHIEVTDTAPKLFHAESTCIKITGLMDNMNKQMLEMFFYKEERNGGGKVKSIDLDSKNKCATVEFEDETGVDLIMKKTPMAIFGLPVHIEVTGGDTEETKMIKISNLPATINKEMLLLFFENMMKSDGKMVDVTVNAVESHAIVEFDNSAAVHRVIDQKPLKIFGFEVDVDTFGELSTFFNFSTN
ncbi:uncharacterized protein LOC132754297 [Ruditapes philippinarum]|uniref:uncharacterized protein LOC132754297 n=1 Tax=Ruditapes philippinarum TaxID=129788 RepID=UPI00295BD67C|nr:uncharacterized protein LOC132754297 [Ruditapes philippinarum]